jgi:amino acid transporter
MSDRAIPSADSGEAEAQRLGYKQELRREFGFFHAFAISFASVSIIVAFYGSFALALGAAGPTFFWGLLIVGVLQTLVALVLAEVSSRYPIEGGIYQWTLEQTGATAGWFSAWAYWWTLVFTMASCAYASASFLLPGLGLDSAAASKYWVILTAVGIVVIGLAINGIAQWILKVFVSILLFAEVTTTLVLAIVFFFGYRVNPFSVLVHSFSQTHGSTLNWVWFGFFGAIAFMGWTYLSFEVAGAAAEEVHEPAKNVPRVILWVTLLIVAIVTFVTMAFILAIPNITDAMTGNIADPVIQTIAYHLGNGFEKPLLVLISFGFAGSMVALHTAASRTLYSFGRDKMIPGSRFFTLLSDRRRLPWAALSFTAAIAIVILLVNLGAEKVFSVLLLISAAGFFISYAFVLISQLVLHVRKRHSHGPFNLGRWSYAVTLVSSVWVIFEIINLMWPRDATLPWYQNWGVITVTAGLAVGGLIVYALSPRHAGHVGAPPKEEIAEGAAFADQPAD